MSNQPVGLEATMVGLRSLILAAERFRYAMADRFDLSVSETVVLSHLADAGDQLTPRDLARRMLLTSGTLTAIIDRLVESRFATRSPNPDDRRSVLIGLTAAGRRALGFARRRMEQAITAAFAPHAPPPEVADYFTLVATELDRQTDAAVRATRR